MPDRNANRPGYKASPVGWIPEEWHCRLLDEVAERATGHTPDKGVPSYWNGDVKWVSLADSGRLDSPAIADTAKRISDEGIRHSSARYLPGGTVILLRDASVGRVSILDDRMAVSQHFVVWICSNSIDNVYLYYHLRRRKKEFERAAVGSTIVTIGMGYFEKLQIPVPPLPEQRRIAEILSTWDEALSLTRQRLDAARERKRALMQQLLTGKVRIPQFGSTDWRTCWLGELFTEREETNRPDLPLLAITATQGIVLASDLDRKDASSADKTLYRRICPGDIGYNTMRMWQGVSAVSDLEGIVSPAYTVCIPNAAVDVRFMGYLLKLPDVVHQLWRHSQGLVDDTLNLKFHHFAQVTVRIPDSLTEQRAIAEVLSMADAEVSLLEDGFVALDEQKRGLMQRLLTGEVRVAV